MRTTIAALLCTLSIVAHADEQGPCQKLEEACSSAGYIKGARRIHKELTRDCMRPLLAGQFVDDVLASTDEIRACRDARHKRPRKGPPQSETP